jgi:peptide/nickel transport system ATP-binding protein
VSLVPVSNSEPLIEIKQLKKYYPIRKGLFRKHIGDIKAVDGVEFAIYPGETLGLVGESGCGKTTVGRMILRAIDPTAGEILFHDNGQTVNIHQLNDSELRPFRHKMQMIFQDPYASLNPRLTILDIVGEPLFCLKGLRGAELKDRVAALLKIVGLDPGYLSRYPHAFSGGQRQRIGIARALALNPNLIVADEAVSALDVSIQAQVINLLEDLQKQYNLTYLFISHDLGVIEHISDRVAVMYVGKLVELAETQELYNDPHHPYTEALLSAVPRPDPHQQFQRVMLEGDVADPGERPSGCSFHPRCRYAEERCRITEPQLINIANPDSPPHFVACHLAGTLSLKGV